MLLVAARPGDAGSASGVAGNARIDADSTISVTLRRQFYVKRAPHDRQAKVR
jgi:hypothetical protein